MEELTPKDPNEIPLPPSVRVWLWLGGRFGYFWVPENYVRVIYRDGRYFDARGPGLVRRGLWSETLGPLIYSGGIFFEFTFAGLFTRDIVPVRIAVNGIVKYDPRVGSRDVARTLIRAPRTAYRNITEPYLRAALMALVNRYDATAVTRQDTLIEIMNELKANATAEMEFLGLRPGKVRILSVELPKTLAERQEMIAQRRSTILANAEYHPAELRRALVTEVIESIGEKGVGDSLINFNEMLEAYADSHPERLAAPIIDVSPEPQAGQGRNGSSSPRRPRSNL